MSALTNTAVFRLLLTIVLLSPLPLGGYRPWAWSLLAVLVGSLLLVWCLSVFAGVARAPVPMSGLWVVAVPFALCLAWGGAQTLTSTPESWWHPLWTEAGHALGAPVAGGISIDPEMTRTAILRLVTYGGVFWLSVQLGRDRSRARQALVAVAGAGAVYATYGLFVHFAGWERILWLEKWAYLGDLTATFVNRNAYGAYAGLGVICCMALFFHAVRPPRAGQSRSAHDLAEAWLLRAVPYLLSALVIGSALLLSHSRGAFLSTGAGLVALMAAVMAAGLIRPRTALILGLIMA
ncbi:MAG TPA: O-antigen ligase domain-containing protein, partial [Azospirillaceae bacterium]|nr:O-antigen ligase domain-containing protein [Azospirillaceae bacterium]